MKGIRIRQVVRWLAFALGLIWVGFAANEFATSQWVYAGIDVVLACGFFAYSVHLKRSVERLKDKRHPAARHTVTPLPPRR
jgi:4-hydroxybenzoate polyprenyltransferase